MAAFRCTAACGWRFNVSDVLRPSVCHRVFVGQGVSFMIWDVGGQDRVRPLWRSYTRAADGMVFVVDSADLERMEEARVELARVVRTREATGVPLLVIANKQDLPRARSAVDVERLLGVADLRRGTTGVGAAVGRSCCVRPACAITGDGLDEALEQLYQMIRARRKAEKQRQSKTRMR